MDQEPSIPQEESFADYIARASYGDQRMVELLLAERNMADYILSLHPKEVTDEDNTTFLDIKQKLAERRLKLQEERLIPPDAT